ncbi:MAG TPA: YdcH family protein [Dongiaceae bacterium]|nr:YdcH family protein [Dongiaceae bacterium]
MATAQRSPRDVIFEADAEYQRLAEKHRQYETELVKLSQSPYLSSEDLIEEIRLKKLKLHVKDEMERIAAQLHGARARHTQ